MPTKWRRVFQSISILLIISLLSFFLPDYQQAYAAKRAEEARLNSRHELVELRTENSKTFIKGDGKTYVLEQYLEPIHYKENGHWKDIDNQIESAAGKQALDTDLPYINSGNKYRVGFAKTTQAKKLVRFHFDQAQVDFGLVDGAHVTATKKENQITYPSVYPNTDLRYTVTNTGIKEEWVLQKYTGQSTYTLSLNTKNVQAKAHKDGSIAFLDNKSKQLFSIPRPYLVDANEEQSLGAKYELRTEGNQTYIDLKVDTKWLKDPKTAYPVRIDPSVVVQGATNTYDSTVSSATSAQNVNFGTNSYLLTGTYTDPTYGTGIYRSFIKFALSPLLSGASISSANITLNQYATTQAEQVNVYPVAGNWTSTGITWNNQPTVGSLLTNTSVSSTGNYDFDITSLAKQWYGGTTSNYGVMMRLNTESDNRKGFRSSDYVTDPDQKPKLTINYTIEPIGVESFWTSAVTNVNTYNGNFYLEDGDVSIDGRGPAMSIDRSYNSRSSQSGIFGYGWISNLEQRLTVSTSGPILYTDPDGTPHTFTPEYGSGGTPTGTYLAPGGTNLELVKNGDGTFTITTPDQTKYNFNTSKKLASIADSNNNTLSVTYTGTLPTTLTDASGRATTLTYDAGNRVSKVTDPANRTVEYTYDPSGNLTSVTHKNAAATVMSTDSYGYDANHNLTSVTDPNGNQKTVAYDTDRVQSISYPITVNGTVQTATTTLAYDTANNITTVTDPKGTDTVYTHNAYGNVIQVTQDPTGLNYKNTFTYDDQNQLTSQKDANANADNSDATYNYTYDENGNLTSVTNPLDETQSTTYDDNNNPITETDANGNTTTNEFDDKNNETASTDPAVKSSAMKYDAYGNVTEETSLMSPGNNLALNGSFELDRNSDNWPDNWTKVPSGATTITWDPAGLTTDGITLGNKSVKISLPVGSATATAIASDKMAYDAAKTYIFSGYAKTSNAHGIGRIYAFGFDASGNVTKMIPSPGITGTQEPTRVHVAVEPNAFPTGTTQIQIRGYVSGGAQNLYDGDYWFDGLQIEEAFYGAYNVLENGDLERDSDPADNIPDRWYAAGSMEISTGVDGLDTTEKHAGSKSMRIVGKSDLWKSLRQDVNLSGGIGTTLTVSGFSKVTNPNPTGGIYGYIIEAYSGTTLQETFTYHFNKSKSHDWEHKAAELKTTKAFDNIKVYYEYSQQAGTAWFDTAKVMVGSVTTKHTYDANANYETKTTDPEGRTVDNTYDSAGNVTSENKATDTTSFAYDGLDRLTQVTDAKLGVTQYEYDANGNKTKVTNANNKITSYAYNELNQVKTVTDPLNRTTQNDYDINGNLTKVTKPNTSTVEYGYNAVDRQTSVSHNGTQRYTFEYDPNGNTTKETDLANNQVTTFTYDADNKLKTLNEGNGNTSDYSYDPNGNMTQRKYTVNTTTLTDDYTYNTLNQLTNIKENTANRAWFTYDEGDRIASRKNGDGTYSFYRYNGAGDLVQQVNYDKNGNILDSFTYTYDAKGNITSVVSNAGTTSYQYDALEQVIKETRPDGTVYDYTYDAVGNRLTKKVTPQGGTATTTTYTYDDADQLTAVNGTSYSYDANGNLTSDGNRTYVYDAEDRLITVKDSSNNTIASFTYRADGMRKTMTTSTGTITFHYDENKNVTYETDASNAIVASYTYNSENQPVSMTRGGQTYYYQLNGHGDVVALTDSTGAVVATYEYDAYGNVVNETGTVENPYRYAGYCFDNVTGLYYLQSRYYNPETGRFLTRDTFDGFENEPLSLNKYIYVNNNPVKYVDEEGQYRRYVRITRISRSVYLSHQFLGEVLPWSISGFSAATASRKLKQKLAVSLGRLVRYVTIGGAALYWYSYRHGSRGVTITVTLVNKYYRHKYKSLRTGRYWWGTSANITYGTLSLRSGYKPYNRTVRYGYYY